ncbi:MAG: hypothetical protein H6709_03235 [Kofleriaceae bacterium]|nr:hypothetical protein [Kofleriaceae bacterium]
MRLAAAALLLTSLASPVACGGSDHGGVATPARARGGPARAATAGDPLLAVLPAGPDVVVELDLARLRANAAVGALVGRILDTPGDAGGPAVAWLIEPAPLRHAAVVVLASYAVGTADAATVTLLGGDALAAADVLAPPRSRLAWSRWRRRTGSPGSPRPRPATSPRRPATTPCVRCAPRRCRHAPTAPRCGSPRASASTPASRWPGWSASRSRPPRCRWATSPTIRGRRLARRRGRWRRRRRRRRGVAAGGGDRLARPRAGAPAVRLLGLAPSCAACRSPPPATGCASSA